jgi:aspartokinase
MANQKSSSNGTLVMKFGGTSVGSAEAIKKACQIVLDARAAWPRVVVCICFGVV